MVSELHQDETPNGTVYTWKIPPPYNYRRARSGFGKVKDFGWKPVERLEYKGKKYIQIVEMDGYHYIGYFKAPKHTKFAYMLRRVVHGRCMGYPWSAVLAFAWRHRNFYPEI